MLGRFMYFFVRKRMPMIAFALLSSFIGIAQNPIVTENALTGNPSTEWDIVGAGDLSIQGFTTDISINKGGTARFKINVGGAATSYSIRIYRLGYYQGNGARLIANLGSFTGVEQPAPSTNTSTGLVDCANWSESATWAVPASAVSGYYIAKLTRADNNGSSHIAFIVRDDAGNAPILFKASDATWQAYNAYGGNSLYVGATSYPSGHAVKVSYNRPVITRDGGGGGGPAQDWLFNAEYPMIRFMERNGYNMSYSTDVDMDRSATAITPSIHKVIISIGHDEYWSAAERTKIENARNAGVHLAFFSGNEVYWKTRWEDNNRTLVCYKEGTLGENVCGNKCDPTGIWTGLWRAGEAYDGGKPENALTGQISWAESDDAITVPFAYKNYRFWRNTSVASLTAGQTATFTSGTLGYEWDQEQFPDSYPSGRITLSSTTVGPNTHKLSLYRHPSGALVFGAGTIQWSWGLDDKHDLGNAAPSVAMQQATVNLFADMGVQPGSLMSGLVAATASTDVTAPVCIITSPANGASLPVNAVVTISGTASDAGGVLSGVEVSTDGGLTWKPATGTSNWTFSWTPSATGTANIRVRGFDDSGNMSVPGAVGSSSNIDVTITASSATSTIFQTTDVPAVARENDGSPIVLGMKFRSTQNGFITGIRYYKGAGATGTHTGTLWSSTGTKLAEAIFINETASGWQQVLFSSPVAITANTTYVASYFSSSGDYALTNPYFTTAVVNGALRGLANGEDGPNGLYLYTPTVAFPTDNYQTSNYWVDVVFGSSLPSDVTPPTVTSVSPLNNATGVSVNTAVTAVFSEAMNAASVSTSTVELRNASNVLITATVTYNAGSNTVTLTPSAALANSTVYTATIRGTSAGVKDVAGNALAANYVWSFTTAAGADVTPPTVTSVTPVNNATGVNINSAVTAIFSEAMNAATMTTTNVELRNASNTLITATVSYNAGANTVTLTPSAPLVSNTVYTATIRGTATGVTDAAGNALAANYVWSFTTAAATDVTPPVVTSVSPANTATGVSIGTTLTGVFNETMSAATISTATIELRNAANALVAATVTYNSGTNTFTLTPSAALSNGTVYAATIKSGAAGVKDAAGNALAADYVWSFTTVTAGGGGGTTYTIFQPANVPANPNENDGSAIVLGVKFRSTQAGYITGIRYYKGAAFTGTRTGTLWSSTGTKLAEAVFSGESASGWQQVLFGSPVAIAANTTYIASYFSTSGHYSITNPYFTTAVVNGPLRGLANGEDGPNGMYLYSPTVAFPTQNYQTSNYWVDAIFTTSLAADVTPPTVVSVSPAVNATGIAINASVSAVFSEAMDAATIAAANVELRNASNTLITTTLSYNAGANTVTLTPTAALSNSSVYTVTIKGGTTGVKDAVGNALAANYVWSFTTVDPPPPAPTDGPGGPILVISNAANPFSRYPVEMLRAEGLNEFLAKDISQVTAAELSNYDAIVLGEMSITTAQATMFSNWVTAGGTLITFRPSTELSSLLGITKVAGTLSDKYLLVNTAAGPGAGIVGQTIQYHGTADQYTLNGATSLATLYSTATTATTYPAITTRSVGANNGKAIAFMYDLPKSIVYTRQGNPAWIGQDRDGQAPVRSNDMFYGGGTDPDWIDLNKVAIPQADEQQRLLTNMIVQGTLHRKPLPRFWFLPSGHKAAIVMTGDDHNSNNTVPRFDKYLTQGPNTPQDVADWKAVRATSYLYAGTSISNTQAVNYNAQGFEIALHPTTNCLDFTATSLQNAYTPQLAELASRLPGIPAPVTNRNHCLVWSDWATGAKVQVQNGMRMDVNYYYWPDTWVQNRPGMFTGSGMPMRYADIDGTLIDCYQVATQMTDESGIDYTSFSNALLDKAIGTEGYYGVFATNMHTDLPDHPGSNAIVASAQARQVPVISAKQMLTWLDGRNGSYFSAMTWNGGQLSFSITAQTGAVNLKTMLPLYSSAGSQLIGITRNGSSIPFTTQTIKGMQYAFFDVPVGTSSFVASYNADVTAPVITNVVATPNTDGTAVITWTTNEAADSKVDYGTTAATLGQSVSAAPLVTSHSITLTGLTAGTTYYFRVTSKDAAINSSTSPIAANQPLSFIMPAGACFTDAVAADFNLGTTGANTTVVLEAGGGVVATPLINEEFTGTAVPAAWTSAVFNAGGGTIVNNGLVTVNGTHIYSNVNYAPGTSIEFTATYTTGTFQNVGFSIDQAFDASPWVMIGQGGTSDANVYARASDGTNISLGALVGTAHRYRLKWNTTNFEVYVDGATVPSATINLAVATNMYLQVSDYFSTDGILSVDWMRVSPYAAAGSFVSRAFDAGVTKAWSTVTWNSDVPAGTALAISVRTGNTNNPNDGTWSAYTTIPASGGSIASTARYIQYKADFSNTDIKHSAILKDIAISCADAGFTLPAITAQPTAQAVCAGSNVSFTSAASGSPVPTVQWEVSTNGTTWTAIAGATNATLTFASSIADHTKQYRAVWTNTGGTVNSSAAILTVNAIPATPTTTASGATAICQGSSVTLTSSAATGNVWSNGATTQSIVVTTAGTYTVTQTVNGCTSAASVARVVTVNPVPALSSALTATVFSGSLFNYTATSATAGTTFSWTRAAVAGVSNPAGTGTGNISETLTNTTYSPVTVTYIYTLTANGCSRTQNVVVTVSPNIVQNCAINVSRAANFNSTAITAGRYIWFNSAFDPGSMGSSGTVNFYITNASVTFTANSQVYTLNMPNSHIRFASSLSSAATTFTNGAWETTAPLSVTGYIFMGGLAYQLPANLPGNISNVTWSARVSSDRGVVGFTWKWSAAVYTSFAAHSGLNIKPKDGLLQNPYLNTNLAGTPENYKSSLVGGARGTGGTNYTGSYSTATTINCSGIAARSASGSDSNGEATIAAKEEELEIVSGLVIKAMPNPSNSYFNLVVKAATDGPLTLRIMDMQGRLLEQHERLVPGTTIKAGQTLKSGTYFAEVIQGSKRQVVKLIKVN